jgi:hypothetical protein
LISHGEQKEKRQEPDRSSKHQLPPVKSALWTDASFIPIFIFVWVTGFKKLPPFIFGLSGISFGGLVNVADGNKGWRKILPIANWHF